jgi:hypothetical protein
METLLGGIAFAILMAAQVLAVIALRAAPDDAPPANPSRTNDHPTGAAWQAAS